MIPSFLYSLFERNIMITHTCHCIHIPGGILSDSVPKRKKSRRKNAPAAFLLSVLVLQAGRSFGLIGIPDRC